MLLKSIALTAGGAAAIAVTVQSLIPNYSEIRKTRPDQGYIDSGKCIVCHDDHYASWARTYHSRMTQEARPQNVQGDFDKDNTFDYLGVRARMERRGAAYYMTLTFTDGGTRLFTIERTVGSRRIEQYLTKEAGQFIRLPLAYDLANRRWISLNGSFFYPDGGDYFQHRAQWDGNCVFCHNVKAQPNLDFRTRQFDTEVAELGIACGSCHGPAAEHAQAATSPFTRTTWRLDRDEARLVVHPRKLDPERSMMVCGHCHGQRVPEPLDRIQEILGRGDPYDAGEDLTTFYLPVWRETKIGDYSFANRFWANGSPRLTAYEYQGILRSKCYTEGDRANRINCLSCHTMHSGEPKGQITEENRGNKPCLQCHQQFDGRDALQSHTKHKPDSAGSRCYNCHMPRVVYGIMSVHPTHEITAPDPALTATDAVPNACNQCHLDRSVNWSIEAVRGFWPARFALTMKSRDAQFDLPEGPRALFAGDALTRALAAEALGGSDPGWAGPLLAKAFTDNYPIVRFFAANGLARGPWPLPKPDYLASAEARHVALNRWREMFDPSIRERVRALADRLRARRKDVDIEVGE